MRLAAFAFFSLWISVRIYYLYWGKFCIHSRAKLKHILKLGDHLKISIAIFIHNTSSIVVPLVVPTHSWWLPAISNVCGICVYYLLVPSILLLHQPTTISAHQESRPTLRVFCTCLNGFRKPPRCSLFWGSREDFDFRSPHVLSHLRHEFVLCHTAAPHIKAKTYWHQPMEFFGCYTHTVGTM